MATLMVLVVVTILEELEMTLCVGERVTATVTANISQEAVG